MADALSDFIGCGNNQILPNTDWIRPIPMELKLKPVKIPEMYPENLDTLKHIMARIPTFAQLDGVFEVEVHVRIDDVEVWAVIGYGEAGDPCLLRFERHEG